MGFWPIALALAPVFGEVFKGVMGYKASTNSANQQAAIAKYSRDRQTASLIESEMYNRAEQEQAKARRMGWSRGGYQAFQNLLYGTRAPGDVTQQAVGMAGAAAWDPNAAGYQRPITIPGVGDTEGKTYFPSGNYPEKAAHRKKDRQDRKRRARTMKDLSDPNILIGNEEAYARRREPVPHPSEKTKADGS
jgi:hypothetical protein